MTITYYYLGNETLKLISVGSGRSALLRRDLMGHEGPRINLRFLGYPQDRRVYLPPNLLRLLYDRFAAENRTGATLVQGDHYLTEALKRHTQKELDDLEENNQAFVLINEWEPGYPKLRPYLPELYEPGVVETLANDPWLNPELLAEAKNLGVSNGGITPDPSSDRSARWSPEWRDFCDKLKR